MLISINAELRVENEISKTYKLNNYFTAPCMWFGYNFNSILKRFDDVSLFAFLVFTQNLRNK